MARRILAFLDDIVLRRRGTTISYGTIAGRLTGQKPLRTTIAGRLILQYIPRYATIAGMLIFQNSIIETFAGRLVCKAKRKTTIAGTVIACIRATVAGMLAFQYSNKQTISGLISGHATRAIPLAGLVYLCKRAVLACTMMLSKTGAAVIAGYLFTRKVQKATMACSINLQAPAWEQSMSGA